MRDPNADDDDEPMPVTEKEKRRQRATEAQRQRETEEIAREARRVALLALAKRHGLHPDRVNGDVYPFEADWGQLERMIEVGLQGDDRFLDKVEALDLVLECREPRKVRLARITRLPSQLKADHLWHLLTETSRRQFYLEYFLVGTDFLRGVLAGLDLVQVRTAELNNLLDKLARRVAELVKNARWG